MRDISYIVGIDIGGTFTDIVIFDRNIGIIKKVMKISTQTKNPQRSVIEALNRIEQLVREKINLILHATTIATNALLGQLGLELPKCALITTKGFRDVIEIGRQRRPELYNLFFTKPKPLIPRKYRFEVDERIDSNGRVIKEPSQEEIKQIADLLILNKIVSVAICLINSYINPVNEEKIRDQLKELIPEIMISISTEVDNQYREYERTSTTVVNAILMPIVSKYLEKLEEQLGHICLNSKLLIMKSDGGVSEPKIIMKKPVSIIESGPAAGVIATKFIGEIIGERNLISFDMGGTTAKTGTIINATPIITTEYEVGGKIHSGRILKGSGYPVRYPFIDLAEVSSGGGSIIWIDQAGALKVGPISAGADPGPACYGKGGQEPTITDANLVLGRIGEYTLLGGEMKISKELAFRAFKNRISSQIPMGPEDASIGAVKIANNLMSKIIRIVTIERGLDPRDFVLVAFGGAGPIHACSLADELEIKKIVIPIYPGLFSALGLLATDVKHTYIRPIMKTATELTAEELRNIFSGISTKAIKQLESIGFPSNKICLRGLLDIRYKGQGYELLLNIESPEEIEIEKIIEDFHRLHKSVYGYSIPDEEVEIINARLESYGLMDKIHPRKLRKANRNNPKSAIREYRECYYENIDEFAPSPVYNKDKLLAGDIIDGPAIIEYYDATAVIYPKWKAQVDDYGNINIMRE